MILFVNVFLTPQKYSSESKINGKPFFKTFGTGSGWYNRGYSAMYDRVDVFKYMLASLKPLPWTKVIIRYELDKCFQDQDKKLYEYISNLFPGCTLYNKRLGYQKQWQEAMQEVFDHAESNLVWFCCNDDHIFIESNLDTINEFIDKHNYATEDVAIHFSHWQETLWDAVEYEYVNDGLFFKYTWQNCGSIQLLSQSVLKHWWFDGDYGDKFLGRSDYMLKAVEDRFIKHFNQNHVATCVRPTPFYTPCREMARHFDGYGHNNLDYNQCPGLEIPHGFFEHDVKLAFGRKNGNIPSKEEFYVDVSNPNYRSVHPDGAQAKWGLEDVPLFWKDYISDINVYEEPNSHDREIEIINSAKAAFSSHGDESRIEPLLPKIKKAYNFIGETNDIIS